MVLKVHGNCGVTFTTGNPKHFGWNLVIRPLECLQHRNYFPISVPLLQQFLNAHTTLSQSCVFSAVSEFISCEVLSSFRTEGYVRKTCRMKAIWFRAGFYLHVTFWKWSSFENFMTSARLCFNSKKLHLVVSLLIQFVWPWLYEESIAIQNADV